MRTKRRQTMSWGGARWAIAGVLVAVVVTGIVPGSAVAGDRAVVTVERACSGGHAGTAVAPDGTRVSFRVCPLGEGGLESEIRGAEGVPLTRVTRDGAGRILVEVAGVPLGRGVAGGGRLERAQEARMEEALGSPEARLAGRLPRLLVEAGWPEGSLLVRGLAIHGPVLEDGSGIDGEEVNPTGLGCTSPATGCRGCCGPGCWGCTGICTPECYAHDECAETWGRLSPRCTRLLELAIASMLECVGCPEECTSGPYDCCGEVGPACIGLP